MTFFRLFVLTALFLQEAAADDGAWQAVRTPSRPIIDGVIGDEWRAGYLSADFAQISPAIGRPATAQSHVYLLYDDDALYVAARLEQDRATVRAAQAKRDTRAVTQGDHIRILLDPSQSGTSCYFFIFNPAGGIADGTLSALGEWDTRWDGAVESAVSVSDSAWHVELRIPLSTLGFQNGESQDWSFFVSRHYSENQEVSVVRLVDIHNPFRISDFPAVRGFKGLRRKETLALIPYSYYANQTDYVSNSSRARAKVGGDIRYSPTPSTTVLATIGPDYAQLESDREIINVGDVPQSYPEKRPFFTASSDLYPGLAVNTRNIGDIRIGAKLRGAANQTRYDVTSVLDEEDAFWLLTDVRATDNGTYYVDVISGLRRKGRRSDYNVTANLRTWMFDKRLTAYTWFGTINSRRRSGNEWESVNSVRWVTRTLNAGVWNHLKSQFYNPNIVGHNTLSNEVQLHGWVNYSLIRETGFFRVVTPSLRAEYYDVHTNPGNSAWLVNLGATVTAHLGSALGNWDLTFSYRPAIENKFRFRNVSSVPPSERLEDANSPFVLVRDRRASFALSISTDQSKRLGGGLTFDTKPIRGSHVVSGQAEGYVRFDSKFGVRYTLEYINLAGSSYQPQYRQTIHRVSFEYGVTERMSVRGVVQLNSRLMADQDYHSANPATNLAFSWEFEPGSFLHFVYHQFDVLERRQGQAGVHSTAYTQSIALKISKQFSL